MNARPPRGTTYPPRRRYNDRSGKRAMPRLLVTLGIILVVVGLAWPLLGKLGLGRLPGDIHIEHDGFSFYFPITTGLIVSAVVSLVLWLLGK
jgi:formate hydrogenlyase subunit 3/multisubunit Na+/H+ antiporter MnhD subunit